MLSMIILLIVNILLVYSLLTFLRGIRVRRRAALHGSTITISMANVMLIPVLSLAAIPFTSTIFGLTVLMIDITLLMLLEVFIRGIKIKTHFWLLFFGLILGVANALVVTLTP